jgi:hypothetical protein
LLSFHSFQGVQGGGNERKRGKKKEDFGSFSFSINGPLQGRGGEGRGEGEIAE